MVALALMVSCMPSAYTISASEAFGDGTEDIFTDGEFTSEPAAEESTPDVSSADQEETEQAQQSTLTYENDSVKVTAEALEDGALPQNTALKADGVNENSSVSYDTVSQKLSAAATDKGSSLRGFFAYDVYFADGDGNRVEPNGRVRVTFEYKTPAAPELTDAASTSVTVEKLHYNSRTGDTDVNTLQANEDLKVLNAGLLKGADNPDGDSRTSILLKPGASLEITRGDKVVGAGEIKVEEGGTFTSDAGVTLWAQGARLSSATVNLLGTTYFADDLTVGSGKNSNVTIRGNYYGYGAAGSARADSCRNAGTLYTNWTDAAISSAIVINGKNTTMDLSGVEKLMLAGKNYIGTSRIPSGNSSAGNSDVMTGESLTVKGTQLAYLFPVELFDLGSGALGGNPVSYDEYSQSGLMGQTDLPVKWDEPVESWGGKTLRQIGVDQDQPVQEVFYNDNSGGGSVYFYLNFSDPSSAAAFMDSYYSSNPQIRSNMDQYLSFYFGGQNSGIYMGETNDYLRYVTNGNILTYDGETASGDLMDATDAEASKKLVQEQINYQNTWYALNRKMITSVDLLNTKMEDSEGIVHDETDSGRSVFDNLVNEKEMVRYLHEKHPDDLSCEFTAGEEDDGLTAIICHNGESSTYEEKASDGSIKKTTVPGTGRTLEITQAMADKLRLVLCTGDVKIDEGVQFRGIIMAKGKLTLEPGAKLEAASLEAARVFQSVTVNEDIAPQQFFWEGDKYVLGNTSAEDTGNGTGKISDSYDLSGYVTYENWKKE